MSKIKLMLADDHRVLLDGLVMMLQDTADIAVVTTAVNGIDVLEKMQKHKIDVLMMDMQMPLMDGYETSKQVLQQFPGTRILILSMHSEKVFIEKVYKAGASGYILKTAGKEEILDAIRKIHSGQKYFSADVTASILGGVTASSGSITSSQLTRREKEILLLVAEGINNAAMAEKLSLSIDTIKTHRKNLMRKLDLNSTAGLVKYAVENKQELQ